MKLDFDPRKNIGTLNDFLMPLNNLNNKIKDLIVVKSVVKNWFDVLMFRLGLKKANFTMVLRNGVKFKINKPEDYFLFWESKQGEQELVKLLDLNRPVKIIEKNKIIKFKFDNKTLKFSYNSQKQLHNTLGMIREQFIDEQYKWLDVKNRIVIDIGANIGDSAIYFALKGAKHVYAFEPYPYSYGIAMQNIKLNKLQYKITLLNEGCSGKGGKIKINAEYENLGGTDLKNFEKGTNINITTLREILKRFEITEEAVLKIDCEGCEYGVLLETQDSVLRKFKQIQVEYHYGYQNIKRKLNDSGFKVTNTMPKYPTNPEAENKEMIVGLIYAKRK